MKNPFTQAVFIVHNSDYGKLEVIKYYLFGFHFWTQVNKVYPDSEIFQI